MMTDYDWAEHLGQGFCLRPQQLDETKMETLGRIYV